MGGVPLTRSFWNPEFDSVIFLPEQLKAGSTDDSDDLGSML
jgi:hypothetical protein